MKKESRSELWRKKQEEIFLAAYDEHADILFRHCLVRVRDREIAKDIAQESFSRTWLYLSKGNTVEYMRAFLFRVANNLIVDQSRRKKASSLDALMEEDGFEVADEHAFDPTLLLQMREAVGYLAELDELYRAVITMRYFDDLSLSEIALALGVSENVVSVRIHRGLKQMSQMVRTPPSTPGT